MFLSSAFDNRIVRVGLQTASGEFTQFETLDIRATGELYGSPTMSMCAAKVSNLTRDQRNYLLSNFTPMIPGRTPGFMTLDVGRESKGVYRLFEGEVWASVVSQPPDIGITFVSLTNSLALSLVDSNSQNGTAFLSQIAASVAKQNNLTLNFKASDKIIANFAHTGAVSKQVEKLQDIGGVRAWVSPGKILNVIDKDSYISDKVIRLSKDNGMVGVPYATQSGIVVRCLASPEFQIGNRVQIDSLINPGVNGADYFLSSIHFDIANRDNPFFYTMLLTNQVAFNNGTQ